MAILTDPPEWRVPGTKPPRNIIEELGWEVASHPPAPWFNWFFNRVFESLLELESATLARVVNEAGVPSIMAGPESERPAASQETVGRIYIATDTKRMFRDRGNGWDLLNTPDAIGAETPGGAQQKADAAVAAHANRTDNPHNVQAHQVPYSSGVVGFSPADVKAALDALAGVRIVEMGSNSNGTYVRWGNGLQLCYVRLGGFGPINRQWGALYVGSEGGRQWTFPAAFVSIPVVVAFAGSTNNRAAVAYQDNVSITQSSVTLNLARGLPESLTDFVIAAIAIGTWK